MENIFLNRKASGTLISTKWVLVIGLFSSLVVDQSKWWGVVLLTIFWYVSKTLTAASLDHSRKGHSVYDWGGDDLGHWGLDDSVEALDEGSLVYAAWDDAVHSSLHHTIYHSALHHSILHHSILHNSTTHYTTLHALHSLDATHNSSLSQSSNCSRSKCYSTWY